MAQHTQQSNGEAHVLPRWFEWFQDNIVLTLLVIAGMILNGLMFTEGIVPQGDVTAWGFLPTVKVVAFFLAGSGLTGVALRAGVLLARAFREGRIIEGMVGLLISLIYIPLEIWASITVRSQEHIFTPADAWVMQTIGQPNLPVSPTIVVIAIASPLILFTWGIVTRKETVETLEAQQERQQRELATARFNAEKAALKGQSIGAGFGSMLHAGYTSAKGTLSPQETPGNQEGETQDNENARTPNDSGPAHTANITKLPKRGTWTSRQLKAYAQENYGVTLSDVEAQSAMRVLSKGKRSGTAYIVPSRVGKAWVDETQGAGNGSAQQRA